jgi:hypothetical protein
MPDKFKAATWNVYHGTDPEELRPILRRLRNDGVTIFLMQEVSNPKVRTMLREEGLHFVFAPRQYVVAYDPNVWVKVNHGGHVRLGETPYYRKGGNNEQYSDAVSVILCDREGRSLTALSYHTPAHVQVAEKNRPPRRFIALKESMVTLKNLADLAETRAVLFGGDDNVDEARAFKSVFKFMRDGATGLRQVEAPRPTHGHPRRGRRIDDFRVRNLSVGKGYVIDGGGDHRVHVREFGWI